MSASPPLVLMHGLWDTPRLFRRLIQALDQPERPLLAPHLPHGLGHVPLRELARRLDRQIRERFGNDTVIDLFGFSMGSWFAWAMAAFAAGAIVYQTSNIVHEYRPGQHVAAALGLFSSVALLLWYVLQIFMRGDD